MNWLIIFILAMLAIAFSIVFAVTVALKKPKRGRVLTPFNIFAGGVFVSVFISLLPIYHSILYGTTDRVLKTGLISLYSTFQFFTISAEREVIFQGISCPQQWLSAAYSVFLTLALVVAPVLTFGFLMSFFKNASAFIRFLIHYFSDTYVFSELNEKSISLASDIKMHHKHAVIVFTDTSDRENTGDLPEQARELRAILFKKDILAINFKIHSPKSELFLFAINEEESKAAVLALKLISQYRKRTNTRLYVFSSRIESELLLAQTDKGELKVRRINEVRSLVDRILYDEGPLMFENAKSESDGSKLISAVIVGLGEHGTEMLKALSWYCQMDGYHVKIDVFDADEKAERRFMAIAPELMSEKYNGVRNPDEAEYTIRIHPGCDVTEKPFSDEIQKIDDVTYVFISLGSDELNIRTAVNMRMLFERVNIKPVIQSVVRNTEKAVALNGITNYSGQKYDIDFIGDLGTSYSESVIINSELEKEGLKHHLRWGNEEEFWRYEYNYNSSLASVIHLKARIACGIPGASKKDEDLTESERIIIESLEHRRWNAYLRSEGYIYSGSTDKKTRNDLAKMHNNLVGYSKLSIEDKRKDSRVGSL